MNTYTIHLKPQISELQTLANWLATLALDQRIKTNVLVLVCEEVFVNIITHAYDDTYDLSKELLLIEIGVFDSEIIIRFVDQGKAFTPKELPLAELSSPLSERKIGGLGWHLIRHYMDSIDYKRLGNKNILYLIKYT